jgi:uncharacterized RmlC-like cupin family protein
MFLTAEGSGVTEDGVVLRSEHTAILDTRAMQWEPHFGIAGAFAKVLSRDAEGAPLVFLSFLPEDFDAAVLPARQQIGTVEERTLVLDGELADVEYGPDGPVAILAKAGYWLHHPAGAYFGTPEGWRPPAGALLLTYRSGPGTLPGEPSFAGQARTATGAPAIPAGAAAADGTVFADPISGARVVDSRTMPWSAHFGMHLGLTKILSVSAEGSPLAYLTKTPGFAPGQLPPKGSAERHYHRELTEQIFVTGGELAMREYADLDDRMGELVVLRPGYFLDRAPGSIHQLERRSATGFASLEVRDTTGNYPFDEGFDELNYIERMT